VDNGRVYAPDYAFRFAWREDHPATWKAVVDELRRRHPSDWPSLIGTVFAHREACMLAALRALDRALAEPKATRPGLRRQVLAAVAAIAERGPEAIEMRHTSGD
jgi:hypothetical protein